MLLLRTRPSFTLSQLLAFRTGVRPINCNNTRTFSVSATPRDSSSGVPKTKDEVRGSSLPAKTEPSKQRPPFESASLYRLTVPPNPDWKPGEGFAASAGAQEWMQGEEEGYLSLDTAEMSPKYAVPSFFSLSVFLSFLKRIIPVNDKRYRSKANSICLKSVSCRSTEFGSL